VLTRGASESLLDSYGSERAEHARRYITTATELGTHLTAPTKEAIDSLNARVGREGRGAPPRLGPGLFVADAVGGSLAPQPRDAQGRLIDDVVGYEFAVLAEPSIIGDLDLSARGAAERIHATVVSDSAITAWLNEIGARAVIIRPDRYYYGAFADTSALGKALAEIAGLYGAN
jgi:3-(3-hydroxy-phenyl)propionate hydroxylase